MDNLPHQGLIRYTGVFNQERIYVASPEVAQELLSSNAYKSIKPELQWILANNIAGHGLLIQEGDQHGQARKRFNPVFSPAQMKKWFPTMWNLAVDAVDLLPQHIKREPFAPHGVVGIIELVSAASIDIIGRFGFSTEFQTLQRVRFGKAYIEMFKTTKRGQATLRAASLIGPQIALKLPLRAVKTINSIMALVRATAEDITADHERNFEKYVGRIWLSRLFTSLLLQQRLWLVLRAGPCTCSLDILIFKTVCEQRSEDSQSPLHNLKYLNAVTNEVLRYHSINTLLWREPTQDITVAGEPIPKGTKIVFPPWALNRDPPTGDPMRGCSIHRDGWIIPAAERTTHIRF
ncbi:cytochrome P450 monooxygenase monooxygenase [Fusarium denticulatum]|uniref:Cytochrome P450 monooxygenase monooxygenase n=1 Tax=Fusarium denticulatum TaxID=48507 RepID=A0A8H5X0L3_9HYPO|nr:cytochrome P450 monooxygenase monooxygenase [Fusarium denticulatum]